MVYFSWILLFVTFIFSLKIIKFNIGCGVSLLSFGYMQLCYIIYSIFSLLLKGDSYYKNIKILNNYEDSIAIILIMISIASFFYLAPIIYFFNNKYYVRQEKIVIPIELSIEILKKLLIVNIFFGVSLFLIFLYQNNALDSYREFVNSYRNGQLSGSGIYTLPLTLIFPVLSLLYFLFKYNFKRNQIKFIEIFLGFIFLLLPGLILGFRVMAITNILPFFIYYLYTRKVNFGSLILIFILSFFIYFIYGYFRNQPSFFWDESSGAYELAVSLVGALLDPFLRMSSTDIVLMTVSQAHSFDLLGFWLEPLKIIFGFLHQDRYIGQSALFGHEIMYDFLFVRDGVPPLNFGGISTGAISFGYWHGGIIGVLAYFFALGMASKFVDIRLKSSQRNPFYVSLYLLLAVAIFLQIESPQDAYNYFFLRFFLVIIFYSLLHTIYYLINLKFIK